MTDWRPIETAPKDGTIIFCACEGQFSLAAWDSYCARWLAKVNGESARDYYGDEVAVEPDHWMPLPEPPSNGE